MASAIATQPVSSVAATLVAAGRTPMAVTAVAARQAPTVAARSLTMAVSMPVVLLVTAYRPTRFVSTVFGCTHHAAWQPSASLHRFRGIVSPLRLSRRGGYLPWYRSSLSPLSAPARLFRPRRPLIRCASSSRSPGLQSAAHALLMEPQWHRVRLIQAPLSGAPRWHGLPLPYDSALGWTSFRLAKRLPHGLTLRVASAVLDVLGSWL